MIQKFNPISQLCLIILSIFLLGSCAEEGVVEETPKVSIPEPQELVQANLYGLVLDEGGDPVPGATVTYRSGLEPLQLETDEQGYFLIENVDNKGRAAFVSVQSPGKFEAFRRFSILPHRYNYTEIKLLDREIIGTITANQGGTLSQSDGASITLPANGIINAEGAAYNGAVDVALTWIDPSADDLAQRMVGDLSGIDEAGNVRSLSTMGMLQVELIGEDGSILNLGEDQSASLTFPIPSSLKDRTTDQIPLWSYDEHAGTWTQEGEAQLNGDAYIGQVSHFSSWNVDFMTDPIEITGQVKWEVQKAAGEDTAVGGSYFQIYVCSDEIGRKGGWLCEDGSFRFYNFPKDEKFQLKVLDQCGNEIYKESYGPYASDEDLGMIVVENTERSVVRIVGNAVNCDGAPVTNGYVQISQGESTRSYPLNENGTFEIGYNQCVGFEIGVVIADLDNLVSSEEIVLSGDETNFELKDVQSCDSELEDFIAFQFDDGESVFLPPINFLFPFNENTDSLGTGVDTTYAFALIHEGMTEPVLGGNSVFFMTFSILAEDISDPSFNYQNIEVHDFSYATEVGDCVLTDIGSVKISFDAFDLANQTSVSGTFSGEVKCRIAGETDYNTVRTITGQFNVPTQE